MEGERGSETIPVPDTMWTHMLAAWKPTACCGITRLLGVFFVSKLDDAEVGEICGRRTPRLSVWRAFTLEKCQWTYGGIWKTWETTAVFSPSSCQILEDIQAIPLPISSFSSGWCMGRGKEMWRGAGESPDCGLAKKLFPLVEIITTWFGWQKRAGRRWLEGEEQRARDGTGMWSGEERWMGRSGRAGRKPRAPRGGWGRWVQRMGAADSRMRELAGKLIWGKWEGWRSGRHSFPAILTRNTISALASNHKSTVF